MSQRLRSFLLSLLTVAVVAVVLEAGASWLMLLHYRSAQVANFAAEDPSWFALVNLGRRALHLAGWSGPPDTRETTDPAPFFRPDPLLGYSAAPGRYTHTFSRRNPFTGAREDFRTAMTIEPDGSRRTGPARPGRPTVHVLGDSWVFGTGVPDELTFAARLHQALPEWNVSLRALGGWSLTQAALNIDHRREVAPGDIVVLGYAGYFDVRHVMAPSRLREIDTWLARIGQPVPAFQLPRAARTASGDVSFSTIDQRCAVLDGYCRQPDPTAAEMTAVTAALVNHVARATAARVYLLHFAGAPDPALYAALDPKVTLVRALRADFDTVVQDDILGFDGHPGPFWHDAIARRLLSAIDWKRS
jgi:hypothetical protein